MSDFQMLLLWQIFFIATRLYWSCFFGGFCQNYGLNSGFVEAPVENPPCKKRSVSEKQSGILLTSGSDLNSSNNLSLDVAGEEGPGKVEAGYKNLGNSVTLPGGGAAGEGVVVELPLYGSALVNNQRAAVSDDTRGWHRRSQRHHEAGCLHLCTWLRVFLYQWWHLDCKYSHIVSVSEERQAQWHLQKLSSACSMSVKGETKIWLNNNSI